MSFTKGCFVGQELTARTKHRGLVKSAITGACATAPCPRPAHPVTRGGRDAGDSGTGNLALALLRLDQLADGAEPLIAADAVLTRTHRGCRWALAARRRTDRAARRPQPTRHFGPLHRQGSSERWNGRLEAIRDLATWQGSPRRTLTLRHRRRDSGRVERRPGAADHSSTEPERDLAGRTPPAPSARARPSLRRAPRRRDRERGTPDAVRDRVSSARFNSLAGHGRHEEHRRQPAAAAPGTMPRAPSRSRFAPLRRPHPCRPW